MSETISIRRSDETTHGEYRAAMPGAERDAFLTWTARGEARIAEHTFVPPDMRGQGVAALLVEAMVTDAREQGFAIVPQCSYVEALFRRHPEWADIKAQPPS